MLSVPLLYYCFFSRFKEHTMELGNSIIGKKTVSVHSDDLSEYKASNCKSKIAEVKRNVIALSVSGALVFHVSRFLCREPVWRKCPDQ